MNRIDWRSDTVTRPLPGMLEAMFQARVGDDVFEEDPTVIVLEQMAADMFGMEAGIFCPSGTMTNQIAVKLHTRPGTQMICHELCHIYNYEGGGAAANSGVSMKLLRGDLGRFTADQVIANINVDDVHLPETRLVAVENTSNRGGGCTWQIGELEKITAVCRERGLAFHMDGARLFNAIVRNNENPKAYGELFDTISLCLSKGLGAPIGSVLVGSKAMIRQARRVRKVFGGGMRQVGFLAAAGIWALENNIDRLSEDHDRAKKLETALGALSITEEVLPVETNIVVMNLKDASQRPAIMEQMEKEGVLLVPFGPTGIRLVTHHDITDQMLDDTIRIFQNHYA